MALIRTFAPRLSTSINQPRWAAYCKNILQDTTIIITLLCTYQFHRYEIPRGQHPGQLRTFKSALHVEPQPGWDGWVAQPRFLHHMHR